MFLIQGISHFSYGFHENFGHWAFETKVLTYLVSFFNVMLRIDSIVNGQFISIVRLVTILTNNGEVNFSFSFLHQTFTLFQQADAAK